MKPGDAFPEPGQQVTDRETFSEIFRHFYVPLVRYARRITGSETLAADVLQDVFLKLWQDRENLTIEYSLKAMLYTMVRNRSLNVKRNRRRIASDIAAEDVMEHHAADPPGEGAAAEELRRHLYRWVDELPPRRREAFTLSRYHGLTHAEIAGIMGLSERTVDTHIVLALRELRRRLDELQNEGTSR